MKKLQSGTENNTKNTASAFFVSKILVEQKKYAEAENSINDFLKNYPQSKYANEVKNLLIKMYVDKTDFVKAFETCITFVEIFKFNSF